METTTEEEEKPPASPESSSNSTGNATDLSIEELVMKVGGATTAKTLEILSDSKTYPNMIANSLYRDPKTVHYHVEKLEELGLIRKIGYEGDGEGKAVQKVYYTATPKGEKVLEELEVPDKEFFKKKYYGGEL